MWPRRGKHRSPAIATTTGVLPPAPAPPPAAIPPPVPPPAPLAVVDAQWAPAVVGSPIFSFEPRPVAGTDAGVPDTIVDGWATPGLTVRLASVRGYAHRYRRIPRQDAAAAAACAAADAVVFAVADGVSAAPHSHRGATIAVQVAVQAALAAIEAGPIDWWAIAQTVARGLVHEIDPHPIDPPAATLAAQQALGTTLMTGVVAAAGAGATATLVQIGDSGAWIFDGGAFRPVVAEKVRAADEVVSSAVHALPRLPDPLVPVDVVVPPGDVLLVGTDGFGDPLGDGSGLVGDLFRGVLARPPAPLRLAHALDFSRECFDDDRTLLAIWPTGPAR